MTRTPGLTGLLALLAQAPAPDPAAPTLEAPTLEAPTLEAPTLEAPTLEAQPWRWPAGEARSWWMEACVELPEAVALTDDDGHRARIDRYQVQLVVSCQAAPAQGGAVPLACSLVGSNLIAGAIPGDEGALPAVLTALDEDLAPAWVELVTTPDGRQIGFELHDVPGRDRRARANAEMLGWMLERAFIGLDLSFSPLGELSWGERSPALLTYLPRARSLGAARLLHDATLSADGEHLEIRSRGRGVVAADTLAARTGSGHPGALSLSLAATGWSSFDLTEGTLEERTWVVLSRTTPSTDLNVGTMRHPYAMAGALRRLRPGVTASLSPTGVWGSSPPGPTCEALDQARPALEAALDAPLGAGP